MYSILYSISQLGPATSLGTGGRAAHERPPGSRVLIPLQFLTATSWPAPRPRPPPLPGYVIEPTGPAGGETRARPRVPGLSLFPSPCTQVLKGSDDQHTEQRGRAAGPPAAQAAAAAAVAGGRETRI